MPTYPDFLEDPSYGLAHATRGSGTSMTAILGPNQGLMYLGSQTNGTSISGVMGPLLTRDPGKWVAGHLLNGELGGSGTYARNLTPLTANANKRHSGYELKVKRMCIKCRQYMDLNKITAYCLGVRYRVTVDGTAFGGFAPYDKVASHITISARVYRYNWDGSNQQPLSLAETTYFQADFFANVQIDNDDADLA